MDKSNKIIITGAAGLVGQNLTLLLSECGFHHIVAIDKHEKNLQLLKQLNPTVTTILADLSEEGSWMDVFQAADCVIMLHAQITGLYHADFVKNNLRATEKVLQQIKKYHASYSIHISSSVVNSVIRDDYSTTKTSQEQLVRESGINYCILRPTLMFGWFDPKHLGWLSRFMERVPVFPIPGHGKYMRQPLYSRDFCRIIMEAMRQKPHHKIYDIVGEEQIHYIDIIKAIKNIKQLNTFILKIPYGVFYGLLKIYALFSRKPPFTAGQLRALTAGDCFTGVNTAETFNVTMTPFQEAVAQTFQHPLYSHIKINE